MPWIYLVVAGALEIVWATGLKYSAGFSRLWPTLVTLVAAYLSFYFLAMAVEALPVGTAYAIWTGIGAVGTAILGIILFGESTSPARLLCIGLIVLGILGLRVTMPPPRAADGDQVGAARPAPGPDRGMIAGPGSGGARTRAAAGGRP